MRETLPRALAKGCPPTSSSLISEVFGHHLLQRRAIEILVKPAFARHSDRAALLRYHDHERIAFFRHSGLCTMSRSVLKLRVFRRSEREERARDDDPIATDDGRSIVHRSTG